MQFGVQFFPNFHPRTKARRTITRRASISPRRPTSSATRMRARSSIISSAMAATAPTRSCSSPPPRQRTKKMRLVTGAVVPAFNNPLKLAGEIGMLDAISGRPLRRRLRARLPAARIPPLRHFARRIDRALPRRAGADRAAADARRTSPITASSIRSTTSPRCRGRRRSRGRNSTSPRPAPETRSNSPAAPATR